MGSGKQMQKRMRKLMDVIIMYEDQVGLYKTITDRRILNFITFVIMVIFVYRMVEFSVIPS